MKVKQKASKHGDVLLIVGMLVVIGAVWYDHVESRERAAKLAAFCAEPQPTDPFKEKLACMMENRLRTHL